MDPRPAFARTLTASSIAFLAAFSLRAGGPAAGAELVVARDTKVVLLQPIDATADSATLAPLRQQFIRLRQQYEFISRGFAVFGEAMAAQAAAMPPPLDLAGGSNGRSAEALDELARRAGADWAVSIVVREIKIDPKGAAFTGPGFNVHCSLFVQVRDARRHAWLANGPYVGHLASGGAPGRLFIQSLREATGGALAGIPAAYPPVEIPMSRDGAIVNYLAGQTAPFGGDPKAQPFWGLSGKPPNQP